MDLIIEGRVAAHVNDRLAAHGIGRRVRKISPMYLPERYGDYALLNVDSSTAMDLLTLVGVARMREEHAEQLRQHIAKDAW